MYLFYFGRDKEISKLELLSVLSKFAYDYTVVNLSEDFLIIKFEIEPDVKELNERLAGTVRIAKFFHAEENFTGGFVEKMDFYFPKSYNFVINPVNIDENFVEQIEATLKKAGKQYKSRGIAKRPQDKLPSPANYYSWKLDEGFELFVLNLEGKYFYAQTLSCTDPKEFVFKDEKRPTQKFTRGTSFRLAKMMVNILDLPEGSTVVDPFCGIGTFLIEGLAAGYNMIGIDNEKEMIDASKKNIDWAIKNIEGTQHLEFLLIDKDAQSASFRADACVFEPYMGPFLKEIPNDKKASKIITELENLYLQVFENLAENLSSGAPVVCILPFIKSNSGKVFELSDKFFRKINFSLINLSQKYQGMNIQNPIEYNTPDGSRIGRRLYYLYN